MKIIEWLLQGDVVIQRLVCKYLLKQEVDYENRGLIAQYLDHYDMNQNMFGGGLYGPKWISTHYTLLELKYMEMNPKSDVYQNSIKHLMQKLWDDLETKPKARKQDTCVVAMLLSMACYGKIHDNSIYSMLEYLLEHQFGDGGWNCEWDSINKPIKSSLHTTLSVLEALYDYKVNHYLVNMDAVNHAIPKAQEFILRKHLFRSERTNEIIHFSMIEWHYPPRWKYDAFRALEYFTTVRYPYNSRMQEVLEIIKKKIEKGFISGGPTISGLTHFVFPSVEKARMNTLRALKILSFYDCEFYQDLINRDFLYKKM